MDGDDLSHGLYQCPRCGGPSGGPGSCRGCLAGSPPAGLIQWLPEDWRLTEPGANLAAAVNYMRHRYEWHGEPAAPPVIRTRVGGMMLDVEATAEDPPGMFPSGLTDAARW